MVPKKLRIAARTSPLARLQVDEAMSASGWDIPYDVLGASSPGDRDLVTDLADPTVPEDFFTRDLDRMLLEGEADLTVHSAKDLPEPLHPELESVLLSARDIRDALVVGPHLADPAQPRIIGTSSPRRGEEILKQLPEAELKPIRGTIQQRIEQLDQGDYDAVIIAACALERLGLADRITHYLDFDPAPQQGRLAFVYRADRADLSERLRPVDVRRRAGLVALVGCPADASLLPDIARHYLEQADVVLSDRLVPEAVVESVRAKTIRVGKTGGGASTPQSEIHHRMLTEAERGHLVVRLHGGDPAIYGHLAEELQFLTDWNIRTDVIPAVTAAQLAAAHARSPLTQREGSGWLTVIPGYKARGAPPENYPGPDAGTLAIYMGVAALPEVRDGLLQAGWSPTTPVLIAEHLGGQEECLTGATLADAPEHTPQTPAVFLVGSRACPSGGWTLFPGTDPVPFLRHGPLLHWPLIRLEATPKAERSTALDEEWERIDGIIFPSRFAVDTFMQTLLLRRDARDLAGKKILAVGPITAKRCAAWGLRPDASAGDFGGAESLARIIGPELHGSYLYPCSNVSPVEERIRALAEQGIQLVPRTFYANQRTPAIPFPRLPIDRVLFTSTSCVRAYFDQYPDETAADRRWIAVGPSTLRALKDRDLAAEIL